jgi:hypothetical protein
MSEPGSCGICMCCCSRRWSNGCPVPVYRCAQPLSRDGHWLWESKQGHGGTGGGWFFGHCLLTSVTDDGVLTGWPLATANVNERFVLQAFLSARSGSPCLHTSALSTHTAQHVDLLPTVECMGPFLAVGQPTCQPYLTDGGFSSPRLAQC